MAAEAFKYHCLQLLFFISFTAAFLIQLQLQGTVAASRTPMALSYQWKVKLNQTSSSEQMQKKGDGWINRNRKRLMIGSVAPTCTYNECRGCKYKCRAEQVPEEGNDPMNSAYHYKCVCHR